MPNSPNATPVPPLAAPWRSGWCCLRCLTLRGISMGQPSCSGVSAARRGGLGDRGASTAAVSTAGGLDAGALDGGRARPRPASVPPAVGAGGAPTGRDRADGSAPVDRGADRGGRAVAARRSRGLGASRSARP